ncbi:hypothetical protein [Virgisporangium aurantiacum]|uniref:Uncharacterized protein n=1 Tax=Virgisporangium aurantiacum TaxID=175570 RepID=A0A8J4DZF6_9ACTN|nr:hypothetical protein [Virgisporangium aurantiacum]GIJ55884.1 hypothetical protein Vau01_034000 [Virgisporangium aurantiacum]
MAGNSLFVDPYSIDDFRTYLQARLDESYSARLALTTAPAADLPALGRFDDAARTATRLDGLRREYVTRLDRLISALTAAENAAMTIAQRYRSADDLAGADPAEIRDAVRPVNDALDPGTARHA